MKQILKFLGLLNDDDKRKAGPYPETDPIEVQKPKAADPHLKFTVLLQASTSGLARYYTATVHILTYKKGSDHPGLVVAKTIEGPVTPKGSTQIDLEFQFDDGQWDTTERGKYLPYTMMVSLHDSKGDMGKSIITGGQFKPADKYTDHQDSTAKSAYLQYNPKSA